MTELTQQHTGQGWSRDWKAGKQVRVVDDELDPELCYAGWMAARNDFVSVDILAHAVAESELDGTGYGGNCEKSTSGTTSRAASRV